MKKKEGGGGGEVFTVSSKPKKGPSRASNGSQIARNGDKDLVKGLKETWGKGEAQVFPNIRLIPNAKPSKNFGR